MQHRKNPLYKLSFASSNAHLWLASLNVTDQIFDVLSQSLSNDEWDRADRFVFKRDRQYFVMARGILRDILARYLDCQPGEIRFHSDPGGKPRISLTGASNRLEFNLSHSSGLLILAVSIGRQVGVDIERIRPLPDLDQITSYTFSNYEQIMLAKLTPEEKLIGFFRCWTRKEAYLKARGSGLLIPLDSFDVSLESDNPIRMISNRLDPSEVSRWSFHTFNPEEGYIGALVIEGQGLKPDFRRWKASEK